MKAVDQEIKKAVAVLREGGVIAYPTEAVYGLGCDPFNMAAVMQLLNIKKRQPRKGLILVASCWDQVEHLTLPIPPLSLTHVQSTWPGAVTWVFPASAQVPAWIHGEHKTIALRISAHPIIQALCHQFCGPIVSTSANVEGEQPKRDYRATSAAFKNEVDCIIHSAVSGLARPTPIRNAITGELLRA